MAKQIRKRLVDWLRAERDQKVSHGLYQNTQLVFAYNSNHMEGSTLSPEQTAQLIDTVALLPENADDEIRLDDATETVNHLRAYDRILDLADEPVDKAMVCELHAILKHGTSQETDPSRNVGGWKTLPNVISPIEGIHTVLPRDVPRAMNDVFKAFAELRDDPYQTARAHWLFETTHPFSDGNGRIGRLVLFKEMLRLDAVPPLIRDANRNYYTRGLRRFGSQPAYLVDTLLNERDYYRTMMETLAPGMLRYTYIDEWADRHEVETRCESEPERNPYVRDRWNDEDLKSVTPSERFILGYGFVPPRNATSEEKGRSEGASRSTGALAFPDPMPAPAPVPPQTPDDGGDGPRPV